MPFRIAFGSCSHPSLPQPLWKIIHARQPSAFVWGGDSVYADRFNGLNWTAVGLQRVHDDGDKNGGGWRLTFPPPSIHLDATPEILRGWYDEQWGVEDYRNFVEGWHAEAENDIRISRPVIFGVIDDHDYGQNNGDITYEHKRESNLALVDFLYAGIPDENVNECKQEDEQDNVCKASKEESSQPSIVAEEKRDSNEDHASQTEGRSKSNDPMYKRAREGQGLYGVQLFDFSRTIESASSPQSLTDDSILWGEGYWVPEHEAQIDPDVISGDIDDEVKYSTTHSVAVFALDVRSNKTPWPKGKQKHSAVKDARNCTKGKSHDSDINVPDLDFLGRHQWDWFRDALANSRAAVNIIVSGLQVHPSRFPNDGNVVEEWSKFPESRQLLYDTIMNSGVKSPLLVTGDVHMAQIMRKDCMRSSDMVEESNLGLKPSTRPLIEVTTSGMTHSWGTSFSSQPKNHRLPLKAYTYFVSPIFMTIAHLVCPWKDIVFRTADDAKREEVEVKGGRLGKQYYLGLNFADFEFDFDENGDGGAVTARIFGEEPDAPPQLEMKWTFDQLSGNAKLPGMTAKQQDFLTFASRNSKFRATDMEAWICVPQRGLPSVYHEYAANVTMFFAFCSLFFLPHGMLLVLLLAARRQWYRRSIRKDITESSNGHRRVIKYCR